MPVATQHLTTPEDTDLFLETLAAVAPGTARSDGLTRILMGATGALIFVGNSDVVGA